MRYEISLERKEVTVLFAGLVIAGGLLFIAGLLIGTRLSSLPPVQAAQPAAPQTAASASPGKTAPAPAATEPVTVAETAVNDATEAAAEPLPQMPAPAAKPKYKIARDDLIEVMPSGYGSAQSPPEDVIEVLPPGEDPTRPVAPASATETKSFVTRPRQ